MGERCKLCGINTIFFYWSTGRNFPRKKLGDILNISPNTLDCAVCSKCAKELLNYPEDKDE